MRMRKQLSVGAKERLGFKEEEDSTAVQELGVGVWERGSVGMKE